MKGKITFKGGTGSGNFGHEGRPGKVGGSGGVSKVAQRVTERRRTHGIPQHKAERAADTMAEDIGEMLNDNVRATMTNVNGKGVASMEGYAGNASLYRNRIMQYLSDNKQKFGFESSEVFETKPGWVRAVIQFGKVDWREED